MERKSRIVGVGMYVPPRVVCNQELEAKLNTSDEWIRQRTGIEERRWADPGMSTASLGFEASLVALRDAGLEPQAIDAIVFCTLSSDCVFPGSGVLLQNMLCQKKTIPAIDVRNQCTGFIYGLSVADSWIRSGLYHRVLLVGSELHSTGLDMTPEGRDVSVLFGDGAGAVILEATQSDKSHVMTHVMHSEGQYYNKLWLYRPSSGDFPRMVKGPAEIGKEFFPAMDGKFVFKHAVVRMTEVLVEATTKAGMAPKDLDFVLAHQANMRINSMVLEQLEIPPQKTLNTIQKYANTTAATLPIGLFEAKNQGLINQGDLVGMVAFGSGFTWGASLLRF